nr:MAG TPA: hypothetical protein [Caudoviricetes sp.]
MYKMHNDNRKVLYIFADVFYMYKRIEIFQNMHKNKRRIIK